jgi:spore germination protein PF
MEQAVERMYTMPSIIFGPFKIDSVEGVIVTGDTFNVSPTSTSKTAAGSGGFNTGDFIQVNNFASSTNTFDPDAFDSIIKKAF